MQALVFIFPRFECGLANKPLIQISQVRNCDIADHVISVQPLPWNFYLAIALFMY